MGTVKAPPSLLGDPAGGFGLQGQGQGPWGVSRSGSPVQGQGWPKDTQLSTPCHAQETLDPAPGIGNVCGMQWE